MTRQRPDLCQALREAIKSDTEANRSHRQLALDADINPAILSRFVRGQRDITLAVAAKLARALKLELTKRKER